MLIPDKNSLYPERREGWVPLFRSWYDGNASLLEGRYIKPNAAGTVYSQVNLNKEHCAFRIAQHVLIL